MNNKELKSFIFNLINTISIINIIKIRYKDITEYYMK